MIHFRRFILLFEYQYKAILFRADFLYESLMTNIINHSFFFIATLLSFERIEAFLKFCLFV